MTAKEIGLLLLFFSSIYCGLSLSTLQKQKLLQLEAIKDFCDHIHTRISCFKEPLPDIYKNYKNPVLEACGFLKKLQDTEDLFIASQKLQLDEKHTQILLSFSRTLGNLPLMEQLEQCQYYCEIFEKEYQKAKSSFPEKRKMYSSFGVLIGMMLTLLLW